jgi:predicted nucleic acid-binding protein
MNDRVFVDTNVLVYAYDRSEPEKQKQALWVLDRLVLAGRGVIDTQIIAEFFVAVTRKISNPLSVDEAYERVQNYLRVWPVLVVSEMVVLEAARGVRDHKFSFWDAQIWAAARLNQIPVVFSEDFNAGSVIEGIRFVNPFSADFQFEECISHG